MTTKTSTAGLLAAFALLLAGCAGSPTDEIQQAGSSTVLPIAEAWSEAFGSDIGASIVVEGGGSGAGIAKFCRGETDIADSSRPIKAEETAACEQTGIHPFELRVAIDGIAVVAAPGNGFLSCLTLEQLHALWTNDAQARARTWQDLNPEWPARTVQLFGPGTDSGTYDYWKEAVIHPVDGKDATTHSEYTPSEDDNVLVRGVSGTTDGLGFFGLAYYKENADDLKLIHVDGGSGCTEPTDANVASGAYAPLSRPLFMYTDGKPTGALHDYFTHAFSDEGQGLVAEVGYIPLPPAQLAAEQAKLA